MAASANAAAALPTSVRHHDEAATRIGSLRGDNAFDLILVMNWSGARLDGKG